MALRGLIVPTSLLLVSIAGCISGPGRIHSDLGDDTFTYDYGRGRIACCERATKASADEWYLLYVDATPEGAFTAFEWVVPPGLIPEGPGKRATLLMVLLPGIQVPKAEPDAWAVYAFQLSGNAPELAGVAFREPMETSGPPGFGPLLLSQALFFGAEEGDPIGIVIAARHPTPMRFAIGMIGLVSTEAASGSFMAAGSLDPALALPFLGKGTEFRTSFFLELRLPTQSVRVSTKDVKAERVGSTAPGAFQGLNLSLAYPGDGGWGSVAGSHSATSPVGLGTWSVSSREHAARIQARGISAWVNGTLVQGLVEALFGAPRFVASGEGPGGSQIFFETVDSPGAIGATALLGVHFGTPLETVFGQPGRTIESVEAGLAGSVPIAPIGLFAGASPGPWLA